MDNVEQELPSTTTNNPKLNSALLVVKRYAKSALLGFARLWKWAAYAIGSLILGLIVLLVLISLLGRSNGEGVMANEQYLYGEGANKVAVISLEGVIGEAGSSVLGGGVGVSAATVRDDLTQAQNDPLVKAVILNINSPGGSAVASDQIYQYITEFKQNSKKPVVASFGDIAASGGYYVAAAADSIVANSATLTGSIGVIMEYYDASGLLQNIGVSPEVIKSGAYKDIGSLTRPTSDDERAILQSVVDEAFGQFVTRVVEGRDMERELVVSLADGRIYTGSQAKANGLVDEIGNVDVAVDLAMDFAGVDEASVVEYTHGDWWESVLSMSQSLQPLSALNRLVSSHAISGLQYRWQP